MVRRLIVDVFIQHRSEFSKMFRKARKRKQGNEQRIESKNDKTKQNN